MVTEVLLAGGGSVDDAVTFFKEDVFGKALFARADPEIREVATGAMREALAPHAKDDGVHLGASVWVVSAQAKLTAPHSAREARPWAVPVVPRTVACSGDWQVTSSPSGSSQGCQPAWLRSRPDAVRRGDRAPRRRRRPRRGVRTAASAPSCTTDISSESMIATMPLAIVVGSMSGRTRAGELLGAEPLGARPCAARRAPGSRAPAR